MTEKPFVKSMRKPSAIAASLCPTIFLLRIQNRQKQPLKQRTEMTRRPPKMRIRAAGMPAGRPETPMKKRRNLTQAPETIPLRTGMRLKMIRPAGKTKRMIPLIPRRNPAAMTLRMLHRQRRSPVNPGTLPRKTMPGQRPLRMMPAA